MAHAYPAFLPMATFGSFLTDRFGRFGRLRYVLIFVDEIGPHNLVVAGGWPTGTNLAVGCFFSLGLVCYFRLEAVGGVASRATAVCHSEALLKLARSLYDFGRWAYFTS